MNTLRTDGKNQFISRNGFRLVEHVFTLKIDGQDISVTEGQTILQAAEEHAIHIPTLCHLKGLKDIGSCRVCLVEIKGSPRLVPACITPCKEGMEVITDSENLRDYRKLVVELLLSEGNHICSVCVVNGHCELQRLAQDLGVDHVEVSYRCPRRAVDASHPRFVFDANRCVLCTRCVRVCEQVEGPHNWDVMGRGINSRLVHGFSQPWGMSELCTSCGKCVRVCPTGALYEKGKTAVETEEQREHLPFLANRK